ncbi:YitT family protein [Fictibacillus phosphorivorans]|uniref:YitT family protein n=1 Tax=Fictibacillus phosphorivorans TaxID=1221500 RepID=UPI00129347B2|nr:YitT family protein [Fictibacillus phosphorivorans]MQR97363.1 YitT family protein [Fictibacillus phosphorivorans]
MMWLTFGALLQGLAMAVFLFPHHIPSGGVAGIAILNDYFFDVSLGLTLWTMNFGLLLLAINKLGKQTALWTIYCVAVTSIVVGWMSHVTSPLNGTLIDVIYGAIIFGTGVGILFRFGASSGGMDIVALILANWTGKKPGSILFLINSFILLGTSLTLGLEIIIFAFICQWISTRLIDFVRTVSLKKTAKPFM